jgi:type IX secretion system PorP/SprF family membrane protein
MNKIKYFIYLLTIVILLGSNNIMSQQISLSNQYLVNKYSLSPAYAGVGENLGVFGYYRKDWLGVSGAPDTKMISVNGAIKKNMGLGASISSVQAGIFTNLSAMLTYAYHVKLTSSKFISIGLGFGVLENHLDLYNNENAQIDPLVNTLDRTSSILNASYGILYHGKRLHLGFSSQRLFLSKESSYILWAQQISHISYLFNFGKTWAIDPTVIFYAPTKRTTSLGQVTIPIIYQQKVWFTLIYRQTGDAGLGLGANLNSNLVFNYTFEWFEHGLAHRSGGTHEITLGWKVSKKKSDLFKRDKKKPYYDWVNK